MAKIIKAIKKYGVIHLFRYFSKRLYSTSYGKYLHKKALWQLLRNKKQPPWCISSLTEIGYASRAVDLLNISDSQFLITADVGDDTISIVPLCNNKFEQRSIISFAEQSAPVGVCTHGCYVFIALFNFDNSGKNIKETSLVQMKISTDSDRVSEVPGSRTKILNRSGCWGFRCVSKTLTNKYFYIATVDRSLGVLHFLQFTLDGDNLLNDFDINLGETAEPIHVALSSSGEVIEAIVSLRGSENIVIVQVDDTGLLHKHVLPTEGKSRSSVIHGKFWPRDYGVAVALWGGDPTDLKTVVNGGIQVFKRDDAGQYTSHLVIDAGVHPTDIIAGDFDGDGVDEIAVLNYGAGLTPLDRIHPGNIQIFKMCNDRLSKIEEIEVPYPRIGTAIDLNHDGRDELIVTLFFERRLLCLNREAKNDEY